MQGGVGGRRVHSGARRQVRTVRKRRRERTAVVFQRSAQVGTYTTERRRWFGGRRGWKSVRSTTLKTLDEPSRCQVGPKILIDRPASTPIPSSIKFPFGLAARPTPEHRRGAGRKAAFCLPLVGCQKPEMTTSSLSIVLSMA